MNRERFLDSARRHGVAQTLRRALLGRAARFVDYEICRVECNSGEPYAWPDVAGYQTRIVGETEFHESLCDELGGVDYRWAFRRGDTCSASFCNKRLVGYSFYSMLPTRVRESVTFFFPPQRYVYAFASATAPAHRGRRLEQDRWKIARNHRMATTGNDPRLIWYVNITNLASRATSKAVRMENVLIGYAAWARFAGGYRVFNSSGCNIQAVGFRLADGD